MVDYSEVDGGRGLAFFDSGENVHTIVHFETSVKPIETDRSAFQANVDHTIEVRTAAMTIDSIPAVTIRDAHGRLVRPDRERGRQSLSNGVYTIEIATALKLYFRVRGPVTIEQAHETTTISMAEPTWIAIGARVVSDTPRHTVTTTLDTDDLFAAVSTFGSAIHSWGPERSFPLVRGHPPTLEIGDDLDIPPEIESPQTDIRLELPADPTFAGLAAPLVYYLGAALEPSDNARLVVGDFGECSLQTDAPLGAQCSELVDRLLFLDCLARKSWGYDDKLDERTQVRDRLDLDLEWIASLPSTERVWEYLSLPFEKYRHRIPHWRRRHGFVLTPKGVRSLPYLAYDLIDLREPTPIDRHRPDTGRVTTDGGTMMGDRSDGLYRGLTQDPRAPIGVNELFPAAFENRLDRGVDGEEISIVVVCNDDKMADELDHVRSEYDRRDTPFVNVKRYQRLTCTELEYVLQGPIDYLHYIGHIEHRGFQCADGFVDCSTLDDVAVEIAFLNACESIEQANALITAGAAGAIATRARVLNKVAVNVGHQLSGLLIEGFPIGGAIDLLRPQGVVSRQYTVLGDPTLAITQSESVIPYYCEIEPAADGRFAIVIGTMLTSYARTGSATSFRFDEDTPYYLNPTRQHFTVDRESLETFFAHETIPVMVDGRLRWSDEPVDRLLPQGTE